MRAMIQKSNAKNTLSVAPDCVVLWERANVALKKGRTAIPLVSVAPDYNVIVNHVKLVHSQRALVWHQRKTLKNANFHIHIQ